MVLKRRALLAATKAFIDANVWDGEDRSGATGDSASFSPDELQELIADLMDAILLRLEEFLDV